MKLRNSLEYFGAVLNDLEQVGAVQSVFKKVRYSSERFEIVPNSSHWFGVITHWRRRKKSFYRGFGIYSPLGRNILRGFAVDRNKSVTQF